MLAERSRDEADFHSPSRIEFTHNTGDPERTIKGLGRNLRPAPHVPSRRKLDDFSLGINGWNGEVIEAVALVREDSGWLDDGEEHGPGLRGIQVGDRHHLLYEQSLVLLVVY